MKRSFFTLGFVTITALAMLVAGCTVAARPATVHVASAYGGWSPTYYNGNLMYYTYSGRPYYYSNNVMVYVPSSWGNYNSAVASWKTNKSSYNRWHTRYHAPHFYSKSRSRASTRHVRARPASRPVRHATPSDNHRRPHDNRPDERNRHKR